MTSFAADLHIHSRYSRATSKGLTVRSLAAWAEVKGVGVLGTGDCTHPGWLEEIGRDLAEDGSGLLRLREPSGLAAQIPGLEGRLSGSARFMLQGEISSIYKRGGKVRKVHNLVYLPTLEAARALNVKLAQVGNLASDGRPILGLDSRTLLRMLLDTHPEAFLVPAHIWTPWFSLFGSMSGFDSVEECYGDLSEHIFAMETGLSSDPGMNWTLSALDRYRMISNSDAHSGEKLAREANLFRGEPSFSGIRQALRAHLPGEEQNGCEFLGTVEFFPEEGKYHMDGHRKCNWSMEPGETVANRGLCPVCGKPATLGVLHRVLALADRPEPVQPEGQPGYDSLIPLREVLSEVLDVGAGSKKVAQEYFRLIETLGPELFILREAPLPDIRKASPVLAEAVERMRAGKVLRKSGYDGEFGVITVFTPEERAEMRHGGRLAAMPAQRGRKRAAPAKPEPEPESAGDPEPAAEAHLAPTRADGLNQAQAAAVYAGPGPTLVLAGPGTGKTHTLIRRVERLLADGVPADSLAIATFTRRAAGELTERLACLRGPGEPLPLADTLHALALALWTMRRGQPPVLLSEDAARKLFVESLPDTLAKPEREALFRRHSLARESFHPLDGADGELARRAQAEVDELKATRNLADFTDLIEFLLAEVRQPGFTPPFPHLLVDEIQDLSALQLEAVLGLAGESGEGFFGIGDPNQSIYGFRGAVGNVRERLAERWHGLSVLALAENYRSGQAILDAAGALLPTPPGLRARPGLECRLELVQAPTAQHEARAIAERARALIGGTSLTLHNADGAQLAPGDIAVLVRFRALINPLKAALEQAGLPCSAPEAEVFWEEPRVAAILRVAEKLFGLPVATPRPDSPDDSAVAVNLPEFLLLQGPRVLPPALRESPPFDRFFWEGPAFRDLCQEFDAHHGWVGLLDWVRLQAGLAELRQSAQKVRLMTLHAAKGLEFEAVFLPALEEGILPFERAVDEGGEDALAEERRLLYVGMTRARSSLCLSYALERTLYGRTLAQAPSRLLADLPHDALRRRQITRKVQTRQTHLSLF
ncbi:MAG: 3'-5' exonuclease [Humidesulfovibrio sp.]|uniref:UvrD-helicase domain-containing protein n=1 Tax=Humidesulfovibrio sp. TaxID=2910988 RepID=UPI0027E89F7D|nr:UvrD-helicase domain-containing protein [Humidesulfovibrio sp.]MDQ7836453.1 3'-5' exonuclease [Humidesulfovibrio sp.]